MKELLILSGKGGTGKTTLASAFIKLGQIKAYGDCDVDAPNLHLVTKQDVEPKTSDYYGMDKAEIDPSKCIECGLCKKHCRFDAIEVGEEYKVNYYSCEGCGVCEAVCPADAVNMVPDIAGRLELYESDSIFSTAQLKMGNGNSGLLVTDVKKQLKEAAKAMDIAIIDGSPGIGCPVIASLSGVNMVLIVAEPSISGISDMERIIKTAKGFQSKIAICVNKYDTNLENTEKIKEFAEKNNILFVGNIPYDKEAVKAINRGHSIVDVDCPSGRATKEIFNKTMEILKK